MFITIQKETDAGIYVSGAKVVATARRSPLQFPRPERRDADQRHRPRGDVHHADERARREAFCRNSYEMARARWARRSTIRSPRASTRTTRSSCSTTCVHPVGERAASPRHREDQDLLSALGLPQQLPVPGLHAARRQARLPGRRAAKALRHRADEFRGNQAMLGEVIAWRNLFWAISDAMAMNRCRGSATRCCRTRSRARATAFAGDAAGASRRSSTRSSPRR